jgi:hypothetical protein
MTGNIPQHGDLDDHHIVPRSWGKDHLEGDLFNTILNRTPLTAETNRNVIEDNLPNVYLPELIAQNGEDAVRAILESHFISPKAQEILMRAPFTADDFEDFIAERQRTIQEAIESMLIKERLDLSPRLRELDQRVEQVELGLREVIEQTLAGNPDTLPSHVYQKAKERVQHALKKNAALEADYYETLQGILEFCDLRELQDIIVNKTLWPDFESRFGSKGVLQTRFGQLAELRNGIRHSRAVDEITQKEGEVAILWFEKVLEL